MNDDHTSHMSAEQQALARCYECFDDGQDTDVGRPMLNRLVAIGWLQQTKRGQWEVTHEGGAVLTDMGLK